jgi:23S rRNA pseudouridine1911/1915/1917 synthase
MNSFTLSRIFIASSKNRLDVFLTHNLDGLFSRVEIQKIIKSGNVFVNNENIKKTSFNIKIGDKIEINTEKYSSLRDENKIIKPKEMNIEIVFENKNLLIINKPVGLTVHPGAGNVNNTLVNGLLALEKKGKITLSNERGFDRVGIVHRLDKDTSGLMIVAKNNITHRLLGNMIKNHEIDRRYLALVHGVPIPSDGKIKNYIHRDKKNIQKMKICLQDDFRSKLAITNYRLLKVLDNGKYSIIECKLETGRTHQIRLHMYSIKHPIVGDNLYTTSNLHKEDIYNNYSHQMLHSYKINFTEPITGEEIMVEKLPKWKCISSI